MKPDAFDNDIRKILDETEYIPSEASWQKLEAALKAKATESIGTPVTLPSKSRHFMPASWAAAAALVGVVFVGGYLLYSGAGNDDEPKLAKEQNTINQTIAATEDNLSINEEASSNSNANTSNTNNTSYSSNATVAGLSKQKSNGLLASIDKTEFSRSGDVVEYKPKVASLDMTVASISHLPSNAVGMESRYNGGIAYQNLPSTNLIFTSKSRQFDEENSGGFYAADWSTDDLERMTLFEDPFVYGTSVKVGFPTVGSMQANAGLTINKDIGKKFFTESTVDVSYTDVRFDKALYYRENENGSVMNLGNGDAQGISNLDKATGQTTTTYRNNVLSVGLATVVGAKVNKNITVAVGGDMYRNFNNDLILKNNPMVSETSLKGTVAPLKWISLWDAGVRAQVGVKLTNHLGMVAQYRKGLVNYMMDASGEVIKNSSVSLGLNVKFNP